MTDADVLEVSVHIAAQPETVFPYFTDPVRYVQWMGSEATLDPSRRRLPRRACATAWRCSASSSRSTRRAGWFSPGAGPKTRPWHRGPPASS